MAPPAEELINPAVNLRWGVSILAEIIRQSGGDLFAALAAYSGGWDQVDTRVPQEYAAAVLDGYGRAVAMRADVSPDIAERWTIAIEVRHGHIPNQTLLVLGNDPASGLQTYGGHLVYAYTDKEGHTFAVRGYAVPLSLVNPAGKPPSVLVPVTHWNQNYCANPAVPPPKFLAAIPASSWPACPA